MSTTDNANPDTNTDQQNVNPGTDGTPTPDAAATPDAGPAKAKKEKRVTLVLKGMDKEARKKMKEDIVEMITKNGAVTNTDLAVKFQLSYSQIYLPLRREKRVGIAYDEKDPKQAFWVPLDEKGKKAENVPANLKLVKFTAPVKPAGKPSTPAKKAPVKKEPAKKPAGKKAPAKKKKAPAKKDPVHPEVKAEAAAAHGPA